MQIVLFCLSNTVVFSCFFFFCISAKCPSRFAKFVAGLATKCPVRENFGHEKGGFNWTKKRWGRTSPAYDDRRRLPSAQVKAMGWTPSKISYEYHWFRAGGHIPLHTGCALEELTSIIGFVQVGISLCTQDVHSRNFFPSCCRDMRGLTIRVFCTPTCSFIE